MFKSNAQYEYSIIKSLFIIACSFLCCSALSASELKPNEKLPILFDAKERLAGADLSSVSRIRVLMSVDFPPFNFTDQQGRLSGVHVDLIREICSSLKIENKCQLQALPFEELEGALELGEGEVVVGGIAPTGSLRQSYAFTRPFLRMPARFAVRKDSGLSGDASKALSGKPVGVIASSRHEMMLKAYFPDVKLQPLANREELQKALIDGKVTAIFTDGLRLPFWVNGSDSNNCCTLFDEPYFADQYLGEGFTIMAVDQNNLIIPALDQALAELSRNGRLEEIYRRYFPHGFY